MYRNLEAELKRTGIHKLEIAYALGINITTLYEKLKIRDRLKLKEAEMIRDRFFPTKSIDYLFATDETQKIHN